MSTVKKIVYRCITIPYINGFLHGLLKLLKPFIPLHWLIKFPVMGSLDLTVNGTRFKMYSDGRDRIAGLLYWGENAFEASTIALFQKIMPHIKTIIDVGANTGIYSLIALSMDRTKHVYAFEPVAENFAFLQQNFEINGFANGHPIHKAVSNQNGILELHQPQHFVLTRGTSAIKHYQHEHMIEVEAITLDQFIAEENIEQVDFIKIDVEMFEPQVIEGAQVLIQRDRPLIICEILNAEIGEKLSHLFEGLDYFVYHIGHDGLIRQDIITSSSSEPISVNDQNYLFIPSEKDNWLHA